MPLFFARWNRWWKPVAHLLIVLPVVLGLTLGLSGCGVLPEQVLQQVFPLTTDHPPNATLFIPRQAPAVLSLQLNPDRLKPAGFLANLLPQVPLSEGLADLKTQLVEPLGLKYDLDIQPWLGSEITLALTDGDLDRHPENGLQPGYLLALGVKDGTAAREFLQRFWQTRAVGGQRIQEEIYKGATLIYDADAPNAASHTPIATALVGNYFILWANAPQLLRRALTTAQVPELSLAASPLYQQALRAGSAEHLGLGILNLSSLWVSLQQQPLTRRVADRIAIPPEAELVVSVQPTRHGLKTQTALATHLTPDTSLALPSFATLPDASLPILNVLPSNTLLMVTGEALEQFWSEVEALSGEVSWVQALVAPFQQRFRDVMTLQGKSLLDLALQGFQGNYAVGLVPAVNGSREWIVAVDRTAEGAVDTLTALDQLAADRHYEVNTIDFRGQSVTTWSKLQASDAPGNPAVEARLGGVHTPIDRYEVFAPSLATLAASLTAWEGDSLLENSSFQNVVSPLAAGGYNYLYLNWPQSQSWLEARFPSLKLLEFAGYSLFHVLDSVVLRSDPTVQPTPEYRVDRATMTFNLRSH